MAADIDPEALVVDEIIDYEKVSQITGKLSKTGIRALGDRPGQAVRSPGHPPFRASDVPLVGRVAELGVIWAARTCEARIVVVRGAAGIGKTALLTMARTELAADAAVLHIVSSRPGEPYGGVRELFSSQPRFRSALAALSPVAQDEYAVFENLTRLTVGALAERPLALLVDDAEHCDETTLRWLGFLVRRAAGLPLLLVLGLRSGGAGHSRPLAALTGRAAATAVPLGPLSEPDVARLVAARLGSPPERPFLDVCLALGGGHPRALHVVLDAFGRHGLSPATAETREADRIGGEALAGLATGWLRGRPEPVRLVAAGSALLGSTESHVLTALLGLPAPEVDAAVAALRENHVLRADRAAFPHPAVREAVLAEIPPDALAGLLARGARLLHCAGRPPRDVADLLVRLGVFDEPWMYATLWDAAADAERSGDPAEAARLLNHALAGSLGDTSATMALATALQAVEPGSARDHLLRLIDGVENPRTRIAAVVRLIEAASSAPPSSAAFRRLADVVDAVLSTKDGLPAEVGPELRARGLTVVLASGMGSGETVRSALHRARRIEPPDGGNPADRGLLGKLACAAILDGRAAAEIRRLARPALAVPAVGGNLDDGVLAASCALYVAGHLGEALAAISAGAGTETGWLGCHARSLRSRILLDLGEVPMAAVEAGAAVGLAADRQWALPHLASAELLAAQGEFAAAESQLALVDAAPASFWERQHSLLLKAHLRCLLGDPGAALGHLVRWRDDDELARANPLMTALLAVTTATLAEFVDRETLEELVQPQLAVAERWGTRESLALALLVRGVLAGRNGLELLGEAVEQLEDSEFRSHYALARYLYGRGWYQVRDLAAARSHLREAIVLAVRHGYAAIGRLARTTLVAAGGWMKELNGDPLDLLTASERQVAALAAAGASNREIAKALFVTLRTVESHLSSTYRKLGLRSRGDLTILWGGQAIS